MKSNNLKRDSPVVRNSMLDQRSDTIKMLTACKHGGRNEFK